LIMVAMVLQTVFFHYATRSNEKDRLYKTYINMNYIRAFSYLLVAVSFVVTGISFFTANILLYALVAGISYPFYYTASYTLVFESLRDKRRGNALGIYNGAGSIGNFFGALAAAGSSLIGFPALYLASGALVFASVFPIKTSASAEKKSQAQLVKASAK
jgi:MFS family permease